KNAPGSRYRQDHRDHSHHLPYPGRSVVPRSRVHGPRLPQHLSVYAVLLPRTDPRAVVLLRAKAVSEPDTPKDGNAELLHHAYQLHFTTNMKLFSSIIVMVISLPS
ncbi:hypothetical protein PFISCL1PPCAC_21903, partial [Pristionchus fissidentatus]